MADIWYYTSGGQQQGPVVTEDLQRLAESGELRPNDLVWEDDTPNWVRAKTVQKLFPKGVPSTPENTRPKEQPRHSRRPRPDNENSRLRRRNRPTSPKNQKPTSNGAIVGFTILGVVVVSIVLGAIFFSVTATLAGNNGTQRWRLGAGKRKSYQMRCLNGHQVTINIRSNGQSDMNLLVYTGKRLIASDTRPESNCSVTFIAPRTGNYRVELINQRRFGPGGRIRNGPNTGTIAYSQTWRKGRPGMGVPNRLIPGRLHRGTLNQGESKTFTIHLQRNTAYVFDLTSSDFDPSMELIEKATGFQVGQSDNDGHGLNSRILFVPKRTGIYAVRIRDQNFFGGPYVLSAHTGNKLNVGMRFNANMTEHYRMQAFRVFLDQNTTYQFEATGVTSLSLFDGIGGFQKKDVPIMQRKLQLLYNPPRSGYYIVGVTHDHPKLFPLGRFSVSLKRLKGGEVRLKLLDSEVDWRDQVRQGETDSFLIQLDKGRTYQIDANYEPDNFSLNTYLEIYNSRDELVASDDDTGFGLNARIQNFKPKHTGDYRIQVRDADQGAGRYRLIIKDTSAKPK
ncbi:MAG: DUF4339 domain-containing protein [Gemmataceae bacterium]